MKNYFKPIWQSKAGQSLTEYALILAVVAVVAITVMATMGDKVKATFQSIVDAF